MASLVGQTVSHYKILEHLGGGGMGVVYKAEDTRLKRTVALKFLSPALAIDPESKERFIHEAQAASGLQHHNICNVHDVDETADGQMFIVMDLYDGETLKKKIERGPLPLNDAIDIALQVARGLQAAHAAGMVHRDIKPANIMVTPKGEAKILDFGLAKLAGQTFLTKQGSTIGTVAYMSPEQARGEEVDRRSDIFSFGVVLYEMLTGQRPFKGEHEAAIMYSIMNGRPEPLATYNPDLPIELQRVIDRLLAREKEDRYQHIDEMLVDLQEEQQTVPASGKGKGKARRLALILGAGIAVVALAILVYTFLLPKPLSPGDKSIAVLPFLNLAPEGAYGYFAGGLHDELLTQLSKVGALKVISRTSVMGYQGTTTPLRQIARELGVGNVVEGSVQVVGGRLRVNVQLIDASTDAHLWSERYDRTLDDAFAIQSEVAQQIVAAVGGALTSAEQGRLTAVPTANAEAYRLYLQAGEYRSRAGFLRKNFEIAQQLYERALALDSGFALAHAELSRVHGMMSWLRYDPSPARVVRQREEAEAALRLAPDLPQAHIAMGLYHYWGQRDYPGALGEFAIVLRDIPNDAAAAYCIGLVCRRLGKWDKVFAAFEKMTQLAPRSANLFMDLGGNSYLFVRRYADAVSAYDRALSLAPDAYGAAFEKGWTYVRWHGQLDTLRAILSRMSSDAEPEAREILIQQRADFFLWERNADSLLLVLQNAGVSVFDSQIFFLPTALYAAWAHGLHGDRSAAHAAFESSRMLLDSVMKELPDDYRVHAARGLTLAGLGRRDKALAEAQWLQESKVYREDFYEGMLVAQKRAAVLAQAGDTESALDEIERLLAGPSIVTVHTLRLDPIWDPIRDHPRFKALQAKYAEH